jgi:predicted transcriptional regulator
MDQWEIAEMLGITQAAVCHRLTHANRALTENGYPQLARPKVFSCSRRLHQLSERMVKAL